MGSPADDIPDCERLLRNVVRLAMEAEYGMPWLDRLSNAQAEAVRKAGATARRNRPDETLRDDWEAVGLDEIRSVLRSSWPQALSTVWSDTNAADVDLARLSAYRGKNLHAVGPPGSEMSDVEVAAMMHRLRVGLEAVRRDLHNEVGDWWPYIAAVHSNIPEFHWERSADTSPHLPRGASALLNEGDLVELTIIGEHPTSGRDRLRYRFLSSGVVLGGARDWGPRNVLRFTVPRLREFDLSAYVVDVEHTEDSTRNWDGKTFIIRVRPAGAR